MTTTLLAARETSIVGEAGFWDVVLWGGIAVCVLIGVVAGNSLGGKISRSVGLSVIWLLLFTPVWLFGMMVGAAAEHYHSINDDTLVEDVRHGREAPSEGMPASSGGEAP